MGSIAGLRFNSQAIAIWLELACWRCAMLLVGESGFAIVPPDNGSGDEPDPARFAVCQHVVVPSKGRAVAILDRGHRKHLLGGL